MRDESKKSHGQVVSWGPVTLFTLGAVLVAYEGAHYATAAVQPADCFYLRTHKIGDVCAPRWVNRKFFWLADRIDEMIGVNPYRE